MTWPRGSTSPSKMTQRLFIHRQGDAQLLLTWVQKRADDHDRHAMFRRIVGATTAVTRVDKKHGSSAKRNVEW